MQGQKFLKKAIGRLAIASLATVGFINLFSAPAPAEDRFGSNGILFDVDTIVEFEFIESNGAYQSTFGVINLDTGEKIPLLVEVKPSDTFQTIERPSDYQDDTGKQSQNDFIGTPGNAVPDSLVEFEFKANTPYAFYLESYFNGRPVGILYSINTQNPGGNQQAKFEGNFSDLGNGGVLIRWDDTGSALIRSDLQDTDFDDFIIGIGGHITCPFDENASNPQLDSNR